MDLSGLFLFLLSCEIALNIDVSRPKKLTSFSQFFSAIMTRLPSPAIVKIQVWTAHGRSVTGLIP